MRPSFFSFFLLLILTLANSFAQTTTPSTKNARDQATVAKQSDSRTLEETFQWITRQMEFSGSSLDVSFAERGSTWHRVTNYGNLQLNHCQLTINKMSQSNERERQIQYTIPLWDLSSVTYQVDDGNKQFKYTPAVPALFLRSHTKSMHWEKIRSNVATDLVEIEFGRDPSFGEDKMNQLAKAFLHLGDLCASQAPQVSAGKSTQPGAAEPN